MTTKSIKISGLLLGGLFLVALGLVVFRPAPPPPPPLPNPNGYDDFLAAEKLIVGDTSNFYDIKDEELRNVVQQNRAALQAVREGLKRDCQMPLTYDRNFYSSWLPHLTGLKTLVALLAAEGKLAEHERRTTDAVQSYLDAIRFGQEMSRGGLQVEKLLSLACEVLGLGRLGSLVPTLPPAEYRKLGKALEEIDRKREPWEAVLARERTFTRRTSSLFDLMWFQIFSQKAIRARNRSFEEHAKRVEADLRLLMTDLAIRQFRGERGVYPNRLAELVPQFLKALPRDPFGTNGFIYHTQTNGFLLYSVGPDGKDDGGTPVTQGSKSGDIPSSTLGLRP
jgi:hypothetical protein